MEKMNSNLMFRNDGVLSNPSHTYGYYKSYKDSKTGEFVERFYKFKNDNLTFVAVTSLSGVAVLAYLIISLFG